jgi:hypothetical protein
VALSVGKGHSVFLPVCQPKAQAAKLCSPWFLSALQGKGHVRQRSLFSDLSYSPIVLFVL